jgi:hypothetical protein
MRSTISLILHLHSLLRPAPGGLQGIIEIQDRPRDHVFFVTFGKSQAAHQFDEGIMRDGIFRWQSQTAASRSLCLCSN